MESYTIFKKLFNPVIENYHKGYKTDGSMKHVTDCDVDKITIDLTDTAKSKIISTRIRMARNLKFMPLNTAGTKQTRLEIEDLMKKVFSRLPQGFSGNYYSHASTSLEKQQELIDKHFLFRGKDKMQAASGYHAHWPYGRGIFISESEEFLTWLNEGDHLRMISMEKGGDVKSVFTRLSKAIKLIEDEIKKEKHMNEVFMSDPILGMITCCPSNLGTCMRGSVHILIPKLIKNIGFDEIDKIARSMNCQARGSSGEHSEVVDRIDISNWRRLGLPENVLVQDMIRCANKFAEMEDEIYLSIAIYQPKIKTSSLKDFRHKRSVTDRKNEEKNEEEMEILREKYVKNYGLSQKQFDLTSQFFSDYGQDNKIEILFLKPCFSAAIKDKSEIIANDEDVMRVLNTMDTDNDGKITFLEMIQLLLLFCSNKKNIFERIKILTYNLSNGKFDLNNLVKYSELFLNFFKKKSSKAEMPKGGSFFSSLFSRKESDINSIDINTFANDLSKQLESNCFVKI